jgi:dUTP pyrophosphatase
MSQKLQIKFVLGDGALPPTQGTAGAAGWDLYAAADASTDGTAPHASGWLCAKRPRVDGEEQVTLLKVPTGLRVAIPPGYFGHVAPRSSNPLNGFTIHDGVIDADYRGEIFVMVWPRWPGDPVEIKKGDRIAQLIVQRCVDVEWEQATELDATERGDGGFGSTGK